MTFNLQIRCRGIWVPSSRHLLGKYNGDAFSQQAKTHCKAHVPRPLLEIASGLDHVLHPLLVKLSSRMSANKTLHPGRAKPDRNWGTNSIIKSTSCATVIQLIQLSQRMESSKLNLLNHSSRNSQLLSSVVHSPHYVILAE